MFHDADDGEEEGGETVLNLGARRVYGAIGAKFEKGSSSDRTTAANN